MRLLWGASGKDLWMDKSFGMVVYANGKVGFNMEHSHADAPMHSRMVETMKHIVHTESRQELSAWIAGQANGLQTGAFQSAVKRLLWCHDNSLSENADFCLR